MYASIDGVGIFEPQHKIAKLMAIAMMCKI